VTSTLPSTERHRRLRAAPLGLLLLGWGLGLGPLAHAVFAHGFLPLHDSGDAGWVQHADRGRDNGAAQHDGAPPPHRHAPGTLEHLQLAMSAAAVTLTVTAVLLQMERTELTAWRGPVLPRWRLPEVPGAP
jgi:hypothetical protein